MVVKTKIKKFLSFNKDKASRKANGLFWLATGGVLGRVRQYTPIIIEATEAKTNRSLPPVQSAVCQLLRIKAGDFENNIDWRHPFSVRLEC